MAFLGSFDVRTDDKGRLICPLKFREHLGKSFIIIKGIPARDGERCLWVMTEQEWAQSLESKFTTDRFIDQGLMTFERFIRDGLIEASCDGQGRIQISQKLREYAGITPQSDVLVVGMSNRIEIWSRELWDRGTEELSGKQLREAAAEIGIGRFSG